MRKVLEVVLAEVAQRDVVEIVVGEDGRGGLGREDLPAVAGGHDSRGPVDAHPVVAALVGEDGLAGVHPHADAEHRTLRPVVRCERTAVGGRSRGIARS